MNTTTAPETLALATTDRPAQFDLSPKTFEQALTLANYLAESDLVPKDFKGKPGNCLIAMQWGMEIGLKPLQAIQNIAPINGRPTLWGDAMLALVRSSPLCEYVIEEMDAQGTASCRVKRRGEQEQVRTFSDADAKQGGLLGKQGPWATSPKRMKQLRARAFALRDVFTDVLRGMDMAEHAMDLPPEPQKDMGRAEVVKPSIPPALLQAAEAAAAAGVAAYQKFWADTGTENRKLLAASHNSLKQQATDADAARTVDSAPPAAAPAAEPVSFAKVMSMLVAAKNLDALDVAGDWVGEVSDPQHRDELQAKYQALRAEMAGAA